jgi:hypothetical protein
MNSYLANADDLPILFGDQEALPVQLLGIELCLVDKGNNRLLVFRPGRTDINRHDSPTNKM